MDLLVSEIPVHFFCCQLSSPFCAPCSNLSCFLGGGTPLWLDVLQPPSLDRVSRVPRGCLCDAPQGAPGFSLGPLLGSLLPGGGRRALCSSQGLAPGPRGCTTQQGFLEGTSPLPGDRRVAPPVSAPILGPRSGLLCPHLPASAASGSFWTLALPRDFSFWRVYSFVSWGWTSFHVHVVPHVLLPLLSCLSSARLTEGPLAKGLQLVAGGWRPSAALLLLSPRRTGSGVGRSRVWLEAGSGLVGEGLLEVCPRILSVSGDVRDSQTLRA